MVDWEHHFSQKDAIEYGVPEAILLQEIRYWIRKNKADGKNEHDGKIWTYNSKRAWALLLPFFSEPQIKRALENLVKKGVLVTGRYNKLPFDRTLWYAFSSDALVEFVQSDRTESSNEIGRNYPTNTILVTSETKDKENAPNDAKHRSAPKIRFNFDTQKWENLQPEDGEAWSKAYPACDVHVEMLRMREWLLSNPAKRKTNYRAFITRWLSNAQDKGGTRGYVPKVGERRVRVCSVCGEEVNPTDSLTKTTGEVVHQKCYSKEARGEAV